MEPERRPGYAYPSRNAADDPRPTDYPRIDVNQIYLHYVLLCNERGACQCTYILGIMIVASFAWLIFSYSTETTPSDPLLQGQ